VQSLLCYKGTLARTLRSVPAAVLAGGSVGEPIDPSQAKHVRRTLAAGTEVHTIPGSLYPGPVVVETSRMTSVCLPADVVSVEEE